MNVKPLRSILTPIVVASLALQASCAATARVDGQSADEMKKLAATMESRDPELARQIRCIAQSGAVAKIHLEGGGYGVEATGTENQSKIEACAGSVPGAGQRSAPSISSHDLQKAYNPRYIDCMKDAGYSVTQRSDEGLTNEDGSQTLTLHRGYKVTEDSKASETRCSASAMSAAKKATG